MLVNSYMDIHLQSVDTTILIPWCLQYKSKGVHFYIFVFVLEEIIERSSTSL